MLYEDDDYMDDMGGMMLGGVGSVSGAKVNPYIEFQKEMKAKGKTFASKEALDGWLATHKLTDSTLLSALDDWKTTYGITYTELIDEIPTYTPENGHIFG